VFPSSESRLLDGTRLGAAGCISASANLNVAAIRRLYDGRAGAEAQALHASVSAVRAVLERQALIPSLKGILAVATGDAGWSVLRPPLMPLPAGSIPVLMADLRGAGLDFASLTEASI
jgi:4-hydroxy-tetrahydrodipicolinate synthase